MGSGAGRSHANRPVTRSTAKWREWEDHYSNRCIFEIGICLPSFQPHGSKHSESCYRHYDKTRLFTYANQNRQRKRFCLPSYTPSSWNTWDKLKTCHNKTSQTIGVLQRAHATIKTSTKMASGEYRKQWHKYLPMAILNYNTTYHSNIDCDSSWVFQGRIPHKILDHQLGLRLNPDIAATTNFAEELLRRTNILYDKNEDECHAVLYKIQEVLRQKSKSFTVKKERLLLHTSAKSRPPRVKNTVPWLPFDWILSSRNSSTEKEVNCEKTQY